jgi:signal transduction histidine kinase
VIITLPFIGFQNLGSLTSELVAGLWIGLVLVNILTSYFGLLVGRWSGILQEVKSVINKSSNVVSRARNEISLTRKRTARMVHGTVQAKLQATVIKLMRADQSDRALKDSILTDIQTAIDALEIQEDPSQQSFGQAIDGLIDFWDGVCDIKVQMTSEADDQISRDRITTECAIEVCREAVSNAVKHDQAESFDISIAEANQHIELEFSHEGDLPPTDTLLNKSLGVKIFDELTSSWSMNSENGTLYMRAEIPLTTRQKHQNI